MTFVFQNSESRYDVNINNNNNIILGDIPREVLVSWKLLYNFVLKSRKFKSEFSRLSSYLTPLWCARELIQALTVIPFFRVLKW